jgi:hypothetical protein
MKKLWNKIFGNAQSPVNKGDIERTANQVFDQYKKSFKDLARYDRGEEI